MKSVLGIPHMKCWVDGSCNRGEGLFLCH